MTSSITDNQIKALVATLDAIATLSVNVPLLIVLATSRRLKKDVTSRGILSLTVADLGFGAFYPIISSIIAWLGPNVQQSSYLFGFHLFIFTTFSLASIWQLAMVSIIRCQIINNPLTEFTDRKMNVIIGIVWAACLGMTVIVCGLYSNYFFDWIVIGPIGILRPSIFATFNNLVALGYTVVLGWLFLTYFFPGIVMICVYGKMFMIVRQQVRKIQSLTVGNAQGMALNSNIKAAKRLFILYLAYLINYFPLFLTVVPQITFSAWYVFIAHWLYMYGGALNASLYIALNRAVRSEMRRMFCFWQKRSNAFGSQGGVTSQLSTQ